MTWPSSLPAHAGHRLNRQSPTSFDTLSSSPALVALDHAAKERERFVLATKDEQTAATAIFQTPDGASGLIQITKISKDPPTVTFRHKTIQQPTTRGRPMRRPSSCRLSPCSAPCRD